MKKLFKYLLILLIAIAAIYSAAWFYGQNLISSALNTQYQGKNFILQNVSNKKPNFNVSGFPFGYTITSNAPAQFLLTKKDESPIQFNLSNLKIQVRFLKREMLHLTLGHLKVFDNKISVGSAGVLELTMKDVKAHATVTDIFSTPVIDAKATMQTAGIGGSNDPCLSIKDGHLTYKTSKEKDINVQTLNLKANPGFQSACRKLFPRELDMAAKLIPFKKANSNLSSVAVIKNDKANKKQTIQLNLSAQNKKGKEVFSMSSDLINDLMLNPEGKYNGALVITINNIFADKLKQKKINHKSRPEDFFKALASEVLKPLKKKEGKVTQGHVFEFIIKNNSIDVHPNTFQNLATSFLR
ncbi:MAG: hypothetical protein CMM87_02550 [Rickettsiales bacterium]|nr:hypothetical protein [Rickettsiales bacterium]|tara:strand:+ start:24161 stop:25225 length:1065 start_codon:yes stop_codon:yes gene_type:complete